MKRLIEVEFKDGFNPPDEYEWLTCKDCPFCQASDMSDWCAIADRSDKCPIKRFFEED